MKVCVSTSGRTELNCCQLHLVYNGPNGKQARFYFCLIQQENKSRGRILLWEAPQAVKRKQRKNIETNQTHWNRIWILFQQTRMSPCDRSHPQQTFVPCLLHCREDSVTEWEIKHLIMGCRKQINCFPLTLSAGTLPPRHHWPFALHMTHSHVVNALERSLVYTCQLIMGLYGPSCKYFSIFIEVFFLKHLCKMTNLW